MVDRVLSVSFRCRCLWNCVNRVLAGIFLSCYVLIGCRCVNGVLSLLSFLIHLSFSCILLLTSQGVVCLNRCFLVVSCLIDGVLSISFRCWRLWYGIDCVLTSIFLSRYILVGCRYIDGIFCLLSFVIHLSFGCILFLASQSVVCLDCILLISCSLIDCVLGVGLSRWCLWYGVNRVLTSIFLSCYVLIGCRCVDGILGFLRLVVNLSLGCVLLLTS